MTHNNDHHPRHRLRAVSGRAVQSDRAAGARLARLRRPALADVTIVPHVFATSYAAVDRELPALIAAHKPDALLMFGLAARTRAMRIETRARNALALHAGRRGAQRRAAAPSRPALPRQAMPAPARHLLAAARAARVPAALSRDAGRYLCNYLCWQAALAARAAGRARALPPSCMCRSPAATPARAGKTSAGSRLDDLARAGTALLVALAAAARR